MSLRDSLDLLVAAEVAGGIAYREALRNFRKQFIQQAIAEHRGNICRAARELGMHRNTLAGLCRELDVKRGLQWRLRAKQPVKGVAA